jgi:heme-degrading monooxygenase HmoA
MPFVRISVTYPRADVRDEVRRHFEELIHQSQTLPGFVSGYVLVSTDAAGGMGRVTIWDSHASANHAANDPRIMATHAKLHFDTDGQIQEFDMDAPLAVVGGVQTAS